MTEPESDRPEEVGNAELDPLPSPPRPPSRLSPRWWLPLAFVVSILVHLLIGIEGTRLLLPARNMPVADAEGGVDLTISGPPSKKQETQPSTGDADTGSHTTPPPAAPDTVRQKPAPEPEREAPAVTRPQPIPPSKVRTAPPRQVASETPAETPLLKEPIPTPPPATPPPLPQATPIPSRVPAIRTETGGKLPDRLQTPLPKGENTGLPDIAARITAPKEATSRILRPRVNQEENAGGGGSGFTLLGPKQPDGLAAGTGGGVTGGSGPGSGRGAGSGIGAKAGSGSGDGAGSGLGITRGIPFGDRLGLDKGDPKGGGGAGSGPGGAGGTAGGGGFHFTFRRPSGGGGPPVHIVYILDVSGSMEEGNKIGKARDALSKALAELRPEDSFNLISFSDTAVLHFKRMLPATNGNISTGTLQVSLLEPQGATDMSDALALALSQEEVTHIFLLSDGEPTEKITDFGELLSFVREHNTQHVRIVTLALGRGEKFKGMDLLRKMAQENNGRYDYIDLSH